MKVPVTKMDQIVQQFGRDIVHGHYLAASSLPSEAELCEIYGTSRNMLREAIKVLATKKLIDAQRYRGLFVMPQDSWNYLDVDVLEWSLEKGSSTRLILSLLDVRSLVEPTISRWAAERATSVDLVAIEAALSDMYRSSKDRVEFNEADIRFHRAILAATRNPVIQQLSEAISALQRAIFDLTFLADEENMAVTLAQHKNLFEAIRCQNPAGAEHASFVMVDRTAKRGLMGVTSDDLHVWRSEGDVPA